MVTISKTRLNQLRASASAHAKLSELRRKRRYGIWWKDGPPDILKEVTTYKDMHRQPKYRLVDEGNAYAIEECTEYDIWERVSSFRKDQIGGPLHVLEYLDNKYGPFITKLEKI